jgi:DNA-binding NarL/FixJ family response regulator
VDRPAGDRGSDAYTAIVVDELALVREGITAVLRARGVDAAVLTRSGREAHSVASVDRPDLVVCGTPADLPLADTARRLLALRPAPLVVALVPPASEHLVRYLLAAGVAGLALRSGDTDDLGGVVDAVLKGGRHVVASLQGALAGAVALPPLSESRRGLLSAREREVLVLVAEGRNNREIAAALSVTVGTVKSHLVRIYSKLDASNRNEALGRALALGLLA